MVKPIKLTIKNIRSYKEASLDYTGAKLIYYYGLNGSGKTTIARSLLFLIGMEPEDGDIRTGEEKLEVQGIFDVSDVSSRLIPRGDLLTVRTEKERGKKARYRIGDDGRRISASRVVNYFSSIGASPNQVFIQMGSIPLPFRSAVEEHIKKRGLAEHRKRRFTALMDLMGIRDFIGILEEKKLDYDRVMDIYKETKLDLLDIRRNFELVKAQYQRFLEYKSTAEEIEKLKRLKEIVKSSSLLRALRDIASQYGKICRESKKIQKEIDDQELLIKELSREEQRLTEEYNSVSRELEEFEKLRNNILADIGKVDGELKALGQVRKPIDEKFLMLPLSQVEMEIKKIEDNIQQLVRKRNILEQKKESLKGQRQSLTNLLNERKKELEMLRENMPGPIDDSRISFLSVEIGNLKAQISEIEEQYRQWQRKIKNSPVIVNNEEVADIVAKVITLFLKKDLAPVDADPLLPYPSLDKWVETENEEILQLLRRVFIVKNKEMADEVRAQGALAVVNGEMWDWWGLWEEPKKYIPVVLSNEQPKELLLDNLVSQLKQLEKEYHYLQRQQKQFLRHKDKIRFVEADIRSLEEKLATIPNIGDIVEEIASLEKNIEELRRKHALLQDTWRYIHYQTLTKKRDRLIDKLKMLEERIPDKKKVESLIARLSSISSDKVYTEREISKKKNVLAKMEREQGLLKKQMSDIKAQLSMFNKDILNEAVAYQGDLSVEAIDRQKALLEAKLSGMGIVEDVTERYKEIKSTLENVEKRFKEVEKWQEEALKDLENMKIELLNSIKQIEDKINRIFSEFLSTFGFDGKVTIHIDTSAPKTVGDVVVSIRSRDGVWNDYDIMRLSGGEGILVAFSLYLAAWMVKMGNVHFLMIDEAQTNLDSVNFSKLLHLLIEKVPGQIHVFTMVEPPKLIADRDDAVIYHIKRNIFDMTSEVMKIE